VQAAVATGGLGLVTYITYGLATLGTKWITVLGCLACAFMTLPTGLSGPAPAAVEG
jgi:hypothetical protein